MGVPKFYGLWLVRKGFRALRAATPPIVDRLMIDLNSLIHQAAQRVFGYGAYPEKNRDQLIRRGRDRLYRDVFLELTKSIDELIGAIRPKLLFIAVDGVAPQAKINQQRARRFSSEGGVKGIFDSNAISPGTQFMEHLHDNLTRWVKTKPIQVNEIIYSPYTVRGEGEHKIMSHLRRHTDGVNVIHGLDTDLIFLSLVSPARKLFLWRAFDDNKRIIIDVAELRREISGYVKTPLNFMVMGLLLGNDFLPGQPSLKDFTVAIDTMIRAFQESRIESLVKTVGGQIHIDWDSFFEFVRVLSSYEIPLLRLESYKEFRYPSEALAYATLDADENPIPFDIYKYRRFWYLSAFGESYPWMFPTKTRIRPVMIGEQLSHYLEMIQWVVSYYTQDGVDERKFYPYFFSPLLLDLKQGADLSFYGFNGVQRGTEWVHRPCRGLSINEALLVILPLRSAALAPRMRDFFSETGPIGWIYPEKMMVTSDGVDEEWRRIIAVPFVSYDDVHDAFTVKIKRRGKATEERSRLPPDHAGVDLHEVKINTRRPPRRGRAQNRVSYQELPYAI